MRKGLIAVVVIVLLGALAIAFWPREVERDQVVPSGGNASVIMPAEPEEEGERASGSPRDAPDLAAAPTAGEPPDVPEEPVTAPVPDAPTEIPAASAPDDAPAAERPAEPDLAAAPDAEATAPEPAEPEAEPGPLAALSPPDQPTPSGAERPAPAATEEPAPETDEARERESAPEAEADGEAGPAAQAEDPDAPVFDLVRVAPDGQAVIAGRAEPRQHVEVLLDGEVIGSAEADDRGAFVALAEAPPSGEAREMVLRVARAEPEEAETGEPAASTDDAAVEGAAPTAGAEADAPPTAPEGEQVAAADPAAGSADPGYAFSAPIIILPSEEAAEAPVVVSPSPEAVEVVQPAATEAADRIALDRLTYESGGDLVAAGRGPGASAVRTYANGRLVAEAPVGETGEWQSIIPRDLAEGTELLRFDEVSSSGEVLSRLEAPFSYSTDGAEHAFRERSVTIERGNNLWRIAEQHYGEGLRYSVIFSANSDLIRDPDLIYPGQVFTVPELVEAD